VSAAYLEEIAKGLLGGGDDSLGNGVGRLVDLNRHGGEMWCTVERKKRRRRRRRRGREEERLSGVKPLYPSDMGWTRPLLQSSPHPP